MQLNHIFCVFIIKNAFISLVDGYLTLSELTSSVKYNASKIPQNTDPSTGKKTPLEITVKFEIEDVQFSFAHNTVMIISFKAELSWLDSRLKYTDRDLQTYIYSRDEKAIWTPYLVWVAERNVKTSKPYTYFRIYPNASVKEFVLVNITTEYLHDESYSTGFYFRLLSLNDTEESLTLEWDKINPVVPTVDFPQRQHLVPFKINVKARTCQISVACLSRKQGGDHSCLEIYSEQKMYKSNSGLLIYAPGIAVVIISWSCFWMEPSIVLGRVALLLVCLLHPFIQMAFISKNLTEIKHISIPISFLGGCLGFIFAAFFQALWITYLYRIAGASGATRLSSATTIQEEEGEGIVENSDGEANTLCNHFHFPRIWLNRFPSTPDAINAICRVGFPFCFVIFVCAFFPTQN